MSEYVTVWKDHEPTKLRWGVPVVRCCDCKHYGLGRRCDWSCRFVKPDGFCAWGEREVNQR